MRTDYVDTDTLSHLLWALTPADKLICEVALVTGWRVSDILNLRTVDLREALKKKRCSLLITEMKTGKTSRKYLDREFVEKLLAQSGTLWVFEGRDSIYKHRTRQAVYTDIKRAAKKFGVSANLAPHTLRKNYAVFIYKRGGLEKAQKALNHDNPLVTLLYVLSEELYKKKNG